jgi:hypothetical protein
MHTVPSQKIHTHTMISNQKLFSPLLKPNRGSNAQGQARGKVRNPNANKANQAGGGQGGRRGRSRTRRGGNNSNGRGIESLR